MTNVNTNSGKSIFPSCAGFLKTALFLTLILISTSGRAGAMNYSMLPPITLTTNGPATAACDNEITYTVKVTNGFIAMSSLQYSINWDQTKLQYLSHTAIVIGGGAPVIGAVNAADGQLIYSWFDPLESDGENLADGTTLLTITMKILSNAGATSVDISDNPEPVEAVNSEFEILTALIENNAYTSLQPAAATCPANNSVCFDAPPFALSGGLPAGGTYSGTGVIAGIFDPGMANTGANEITYTAPDLCSSSCTFTITVNAELQVDAGNDQTVYINSGNAGPSTAQLPHCATITAVVTNNNGTPAYLWSPGAQTASQITVCPLVTKTYSVTVTADQCTGSDNITVHVIDINGGLSGYLVNNNPNKVYMCHTDPVTNIKTTIQVNINASCSSSNSLCYHLNHGDVLGQCGPFRPEGGPIYSRQTFGVFPNPFIDRANIHFTMEEDTHLTLEVFDITGRRIQTLFNENAEAGQPYDVIFDGTNLPEGIYIYKAISGENYYTGKMLLKKE